MQLFDIDVLKQFGSRTSTQGYQPKFTYDKKVIKQQATIGGYLVDDWKAEIFACKVCNILGLPVVHQDACEIGYPQNNVVYRGVISSNFTLVENLQYIPFSYLMSKANTSLDGVFNSLTVLQKIDFIADVVATTTSIRFETYKAYLIKLALLDIIIGNIDRHTKNFGVMLKWRTYIPSIVFDNGMSLCAFANDPNFYTSLDSYLRETYILPYGEEPFTLLALLIKEFNLTAQLNSMLPQLEALLQEDFPNSYGKEYYIRVLKFIRGL